MLHVKMHEPGGRIGVEIRVLGPTELVDETTVVPLGGAHVRSVLAQLALQVRRPVPTERLAAMLWPDSPPATARTLVQGYVSRLRKALADSDRASIETRQEGYCLRIDPARVDAHRARRLVERAGALSGRARVEALGAALGLWRGPALVDVIRSGPLESAARDLEELRLTATEQWAQANIELGDCSTPVDDLHLLVAEHPLRERLVGLLARALAGSGRRGEAVELLHRTQRRLSASPAPGAGEELRRVRQELLAGAPRGDPAGKAGMFSSGTGSPPRAAPLSAGGAVVPPAQLPAPVTLFTGRAGELSEMDGLLSGQPPVPQVATVVGPAGVGKTALAVSWAYRSLRYFPDGQLFASLREFAPAGPRVPPSEVLRGFLLALGVSPGDVPFGLTERSEMYRELLTGRRMLVVLDDVRDSEQVRPLAPGVAGTVLLVTSRLRRAEGAGVRLRLEPLPTAEAARLIGGAAALPPDSGEALRLAELCGNLPLALRIAAARLNVSPRPWELIDELEDGAQRLDALSVEEYDTGVRRAIDTSHEQLGRPEARLLCLLALLPDHEFGSERVADVCGVDVGEARRGLEALCEAHLLVVSGDGRFRMHELFRLNALRHGAAELTDGQVAAVRERAGRVRATE